MPPNILGSQQRPSPRFLFPQTETNFQAGRPQPLSNNVGAQPTLFDRPDAFAKNNQLHLRQPGEGVSTVLDTARQQTQAAAATPDNTFAAIGQALLQGMGQVQQATEPPIPPRPGQPGLPMERATGLIGQEALEKPVTPINSAIDPFGASAQTVGAAVINNPFITRKGRQALREGRLPEFNDIMPAFWRFTSPTIIQSLQGLMRSGGVRLEEQEFFANVFRPPGL